MPIHRSPILPPVNVSPQPDKDTRKGLTDYTGNSADDRVLHINLGFFKYGTNDKTHAAALVLSLLLFIAIISVIITGMFTNNVAWADKVFQWLSGAFLFVSGVALGGKGGQKSKKPHYDDDD